MSETRTLSFSVTGDFLTRHARARVREGAWDQALAFLTGSLDGMSESQAFSVLKGDQVLVDTEEGEMTLAPVASDDPSVRAYHQHLEWLYAGSCRIADRWYRPHAIVRHWPHRMAAARLVEVSEADLTAMARDLSPNGQADHVETVRDDQGRRMAVLFAPSETPPIWLQNTFRGTPAEAYRAFVAIRGRDDLIELGDDTEFRQSVVASVSGRSTPQAISTSPVMQRIQEQIDAQSALDDPKRMATLSREIAQQADAGAGWLTLELTDHGRRRVPKAPFLRWALKNTDHAAQVPDWAPVCPRDLKMIGDSPDHSDWMLGAGLDLDAWYGEENEPLRQDSYAHAGRILRGMTGRDAMVLSGSGRTTGHVRHATSPEAVQSGEILVLKAADARYLDAVTLACTDGAGAVVVETGGALAHLIQVARASNIRIVRLDLARKRLPEGACVTVDCDAGAVTITP